MTWTEAFAEAYNLAKSSQRKHYVYAYWDTTGCRKIVRYAVTTTPVLVDFR
jgi:hypothetical protein